MNPRARIVLLFALLLALLTSACGPDSDPGNEGETASGSPDVGIDVGWARPDASAEADASTQADASTRESADPADGSAPDVSSTGASAPTAETGTDACPLPECPLDAECTYFADSGCYLVGWEWDIEGDGTADVRCEFDPPCPPPFDDCNEQCEQILSCCRTCSVGQACGDTCISRDLTCHQPPGCACNASP